MNEFQKILWNILTGIGYFVKGIMVLIIPLVFIFDIFTGFKYHETKGIIDFIFK